MPPVPSGWPASWDRWSRSRRTRSASGGRVTTRPTARAERSPSAAPVQGGGQIDLRRTHDGVDLDVLVGVMAARSPGTEEQGRNSELPLHQEGVAGPFG